VEEWGGFFWGFSRGGNKVGVHLRDVLKMTEPKRKISYWLLLGDFVFYVALFLFSLAWRRNWACVWGGLIAVPGFVLWFMAKLELGSSFTGVADARELVTTGLYSRIRHPIYFFSTFALLGTAICLGYRFFYVFVGVSVVAQLWRMRREEKVLREKFGQEYLD
jgi:protein-S-isoprenylcysteine O-methyltransferase Ste14